MEEAEITGCSAAEDGESGNPATITLGFGPGQVFAKERAEKRDNAALIQAACAKVLGVPVRIACEIGDRAAVDDAAVDRAPVDRAPVNDAAVDRAPVDDAMPGAEDAAPGTGYDSGGKDDDSGGTAGAGTTGAGTDNGGTDASGTADVSGVTAGAGPNRAGMAGVSAGTDSGGTAADGTGMDPYSQAAEEPVGDEREARTAGDEEETRTAGDTAGQAADARGGALKDPAVMKIVKAFDGRIVAD